MSQKPGQTQYSATKPGCWQSHWFATATVFTAWHPGGEVLNPASGCDNTTTSQRWSPALCGHTRPN